MGPSGLGTSIVGLGTLLGGPGVISGGFVAGGLGKISGGFVVGGLGRISGGFIMGGPGNVPVGLGGGLRTGRTGGRYENGDGTVGVGMDVVGGCGILGG